MVTSTFYVLFILLEQDQVHRAKRDIVSTAPADLWTDHSVPLGVPFYLSCPIDSYHAIYTWEHSGQSSPCLQMQSNCLHLIPAIAQENYGVYECVSKEKDYTKVVKTYQLSEQRIPRIYKKIIPGERNYASADVSQKALIVLGLAVAALLWLLFKLHSTFWKVFLMLKTSCLKMLRQHSQALFLCLC